MNELVSRAYTCRTPVSASRVWSALTDSEQTPTYLYGMTLVSSWTNHATLHAAHPLGHALRGEVLCCRPGERLSYVLQGVGDDPPVYLTWQIAPDEDGCTVRLEVDELGADGDGDDTWPTVLERLAELLAAA
ncbi:SRPBCC domain-containing protein [Cellulomonas sp. URHE0023]|uniref:SRPBCC domain-containing protein n=1 Tax=Cellulomonas sp. URHE0023 TaxID=1380354 RepID=UPI0004840127|nr:SRPBCC domain-containing protein [Cellulomonas sp. URHE0023]